MPEEISAEIKKVIKDESYALLAEIRSGAPSSDEFAPIDWEGKPRVKLRDAYEVRISKDGLFSRIGIMGAKKKNQFFFAIFMEFGTKFIRARPHILPAWSKRVNGCRLAVKNATIRALHRTANMKVSDV
jgi:hypothetical protein